MVIIDNRDISEEELKAMKHGIIIPYSWTIDEIKNFSKEYKKALFDYLQNKPSNIEYFTNLGKTLKKETYDNVCKDNAGAFENYLPYISVLATAHCNLSCKGCGACSGLADKKEMSIEELIAIFNRYNSLCKEVNFTTKNIDIVGGEPLLHSDIDTFLSTIRKLNPYQGITLITNGLLLCDMPMKFFDVLKNNEIRLKISIYGKGAYFYNIGLDLMAQQTTMCSHCSGHSVVYYEKLKTTNIGGAFLRANGDLHFCGFGGALNINRYFNQNIELIENRDYVNVFKINSQQLLDFIHQPECAFHRYCGKRKVVPWGISKNSLDEWLM